MKTVDKIRSLCPKKWYYHLLFVVSIIIIMILASLKSTPKLGGLTAFDKLNHIAAFLVLSFVFELSYPLLSSRIKQLFLFLFAITIELVQLFIPWRSAELLDVFASSFGVVLFYLFCLTLDRFVSLVSKTDS